MDNSVKIYSLSTCSHCRATKTFLDECHVKYDFTYVDLLEGDERTAKGGRILCVACGMIM